MEKLLSARQVAEYLGMHLKTLYKALRENRMALKFVRLQGRTIAFRPKDVEAYLSEREVNRTGDGIRKRRKLTFIEQMKRKHPHVRIVATDEEARLLLSRIQQPKTEEEWEELAARMDKGEKDE
jgi:excisionase family DNA binding protein